MSFSTLSGQLFLVEADPPFERIEIQFMPQGIVNNRNSDISNVRIVARNNPLLHHTGGNEDLKFQLSFYSEQADRRDVHERCNWLKSLTYNNGRNGAVRNVLLVMGEAYSDMVWLVKSVSVKPEMHDDTANFLPIQAKVDISLMLDERHPLTIDKVRNQ